MIELVVVTSLLGVMLTAGAYNMRQAMAREQADGWVRALVHDLAAAQQAAMTRRTMVTAEFEKNTFSIAGTGAGVLRADTLPSHMSFGDTRLSFTFDRRGVPSGDLTIPVSSTSGRSYAITIEPMTGRVTYSEL